MDPANADVKLLYQLSKVLLEESSSVSTGGTSSLYYALALLEWIIQNESLLHKSPIDLTSGGGSVDSTKSPSPAQPSKSSKAAVSSLTLLSPPAMVKWAEAHFELWSRKGVAAEEYHLTRARQLYESAFRRSQDLRTPATLHSYSRVLMLLGEMEAALAVAKMIQDEFDHDSEYANYLFFAGGICKALGMHEKANSYFFEASEIGPPKFFSKLEMMMIISRTIEQESANDETEEDGAYKMERFLLCYVRFVFRHFTSFYLSYSFHFLFVVGTCALAA